MSSQKIWDFWAERYHKLWVQKVSLYPTRKEVISILKEKLQKDKKYKILDVGCGTGQLLLEMKNDFSGYDLELTGLDFSKKMIRIARNKDENIKFINLNVDSINKLNEKYDFIICTHSFPYYKNQKNVLTDIKKLLTNEGYFLLAQASQNSIYDYIAMFFVKFTTGKARYPSVKEINKMTQGLFNCEVLIRIKERIFMPSIFLFILRG